MAGHAHGVNIQERLTRRRALDLRVITPES
jgi:hypothetical protein